MSLEIIIKARRGKLSSENAIIYYGFGEPFYAAAKLSLYLSFKKSNAKLKFHGLKKRKLPDSLEALIEFYINKCF